MRLPRSIRPRLAIASVVATVLATPVFGVGATAILSAGAAAAAERDVAVAADALASATAARVAAESRHAELTKQLQQATIELDTQFADAADLAAELESARSDMRLSAVTAFIEGGDADVSIGLLGGDDLAEVSGRRTFSASRSLDWADAAARFESLKEDNDPKLVALAERREALASQVSDATDAVFQASAVEADAERVSAEAVRREAELAADRAAAERAAARDAAKKASAAPKAAAAPKAPAPAATPVVNPAPSTSAIVIMTEMSAPLPELPPFGPPEEAWAELRRCESSGNYRAVSRSGRYRGAYQFDQQTWNSMGGRGDPAGALPIEQDARAKFLYAQRGARAWPHCGRALG